MQNQFLTIKEKKMKERSKLYFELLNISEDDIRECDNSNQLNEWRFEIEVQISITNSKISELKDREDKDAKAIENLRRTQGYRKVLGLLIILIDNRRGVIKRKNKVDKNTALINIFKEILPKDLYLSGLSLLHERLEENIENNWS